MKKILLAIIGVFLISATSIFVYAATKDVDEKEIGYGSNTHSSYYEVTIDGCQYIAMVRTSNGQPVITLTHKGNCTNHAK